MNVNIPEEYWAIMAAILILYGGWQLGHHWVFWIALDVAVGVAILFEAGRLREERKNTAEANTSGDTDTESVE